MPLLRQHPVRVVLDAPGLVAGGCRKEKAKGKEGGEAHERAGETKQRITQREEGGARLDTDYRFFDMQKVRFRLCCPVLHSLIVLNSGYV